MKTPKEKASELMLKYWHTINGMAEDSISLNQAKSCAILELGGRIEQIEKMASYWDLRSGSWYKDELSEIEEIRIEIELL